MVDGFINLDKEAGFSSHQAVAAVRRLTGSKAGHAGTLDPLATGVLPICLGKATRLAEYVTGQEKEYLTRIHLGVETDSYDAAGTVQAVKDAAHLHREDIERLLPDFCGSIMQVPPLISAIKQGGVPLYKRARRGETPQLTARAVEIHGIEITDAAFGVAEPYVDLRVSCGKGVYIRSLAHDLGQLLGTGAHVASLRRLRVGSFAAENTYTLAQIENMLAKGDNSFLLPMGLGVERLPQFIAPPESVNRLLHGNKWRLTDYSHQEQPVVRVETTDGLLLGIGNISISQDEHGGYTLNMDKVLAEAGQAMQAVAGISDTENYTVIAIGNFDGVHVGHQQLLRVVCEYQRRLGGNSAAVSFTPHPLQLLTGQTPPLLHTAAEKREALAGCGVDALINLDFNETLRNSSPQQFVEDIIVRRFGAKQVVVGFNFHFGAGGVGSAHVLRDLCAAYNVDVRIVEEVSSPYGVVSSSNIRRHLHEGDMTAVNHMLGYWYEMSGEVIMGQQLGRKLGFPTANFLPPLGKALPPCGVYAVQIVWQGRLYNGVANFGFKPTIISESNSGETQPLMEAHLFDMEAQLYGEWITVRLGGFLRGEKTFQNITRLVTQIGEDSKTAREYLRDYCVNKNSK